MSETIEQRVKTIVIDQLNVTEDALHANARFEEDLGADSLAHGGYVICVGTCESLSRAFVKHPKWIVCENLETAFFAAETYLPRT